jgi:prevent-host-death family protein
MYVKQHVDNFVKLVYNSLYMLQPTIITARDILRNYKNIITKVKETKQPALIISQKEPQVAIVSLEDFEKLQNLGYKNSAKSLFDTALQVRELLKNENLPADLSERHDFYTYEEDADKHR